MIAPTRLPRRGQGEWLCSAPLRLAEALSVCGELERAKELVWKGIIYKGAETHQTPEMATVEKTRERSVVENSESPTPHTPLTFTHIHKQMLLVPTNSSDKVLVVDHTLFFSLVVCVCKCVCGEEFSGGEWVTAKRN